LRPFSLLRRVGRSHWPWHSFRVRSNPQGYQRGPRPSVDTRQHDIFGYKGHHLHEPVVRTTAQALSQMRQTKEDVMRNLGRKQIVTFAAAVARALGTGAAAAP